MQVRYSVSSYISLKKILHFQQLTVWSKCTIKVIFPWSGLDMSYFRHSHSYSIGHNLHHIPFYENSWYTLHISLLSSQTTFHTNFLHCEHFTFHSHFHDTSCTTNMPHFLHATFHSHFPYYRHFHDTSCATDMPHFIHTSTTLPVL